MSFLTPPLGPEDHVMTGAGRAVTLVEFGDHECLTCRQAQPMVQAVLRRLQDRVTFAFRHFPRVDHARSMSSALAAEAAGLQGEFWSMHEMLLENQNALELDDLVGYARDLGLNADRFMIDLDSDACLARVRRDFTSAARSGVTATPAFFIDGLRYDGPRDVDAMVDALELAMEGVQSFRENRI
jgi:protein-disulfide isomerase